VSILASIPEPGPDRDWLADQIQQAARAQTEREAALNSPVITRSDAKLIAHCGNDATWDRWCKKWSVRSVSHGRYARHEVMNALKIEAGERGKLARDRKLSSGR